jgi:signal transduction histidine kinase
VALDPAPREFTGLLRRLLGRGMALRSKLAAPGLAVPIGVTALERVLANLVTNAREAMRPGGRLTLHSYLKYPAPASGSQVAIEVQDTSTGIPGDTIPHLFEPHFITRADGTGRGLAIVHDLVAEAGRSVEVESTPGQGTIIRLLLPCPRGTSRPSDSAI